MNAKIIKKHISSTNIYKQLKAIQIDTISQRGLGLERVFKTRCIKNFVNQGIIQARILKQIKDESNPPFKETVVIEMNHLCKNENILPLEKIDYFHRETKTHNLKKPIIPNLYDLLSQKYISTKFKETYLLSPQERKMKFLKKSLSHKKFIIDPNRLNFIKETKNKRPLFGMYTPNYNSINPHVPSIKLSPISVEVSPRGKIIKDKLSKLLGNHNQSPIQKTLKSVNSNDYNYSLNDNSDNVTKNGVLSHVRSFDKYTPRNDLTKRLYHESYIEPIKPIKPSLNLSVPNFDLMLPRKMKPHRTPKIPAIIEYNPDYTVIFNNRLGSKKLNEATQKKKRLIQKILRSANPPSYYLSVPEINNIQMNVPNVIIK